MLNVKLMLPNQTSYCGFACYAVYIYQIFCVSFQSRSTASFWRSDVTRPSSLVELLLCNVTIEWCLSISSSMVPTVREFNQPPVQSILVPTYRRWKNGVSIVQSLYTRTVETLGLRRFIHPTELGPEISLPTQEMCKVVPYLPMLSLHHFLILGTSLAVHLFKAPAPWTSAISVHKHLKSAASLLLYYSFLTNPLFPLWIVWRILTMRAIGLSPAITESAGSRLNGVQMEVLTSLFSASALTVYRTSPSWGVWTIILPLTKGEVGRSH